VDGAGRAGHMEDLDMSCPKHSTGALREVRLSQSDKSAPAGGIRLTGYHRISRVEQYPAERRIRAGNRPRTRFERLRQSLFTLPARQPAVTAVRSDGPRNCSKNKG
jgi:hypothetical protein